MDEQIAEAVIRQTMDFWVNPEIERRRETGKLPEDFALSAAQVILDPEAEMPIVRLNEEVKATLLVKVKRNVVEGDELAAEDIASYEDIMLSEDDHPNAGHITIVPHEGGWGLAFDFRRNAARIGEHAEAARDFLDTAVWARDAGKHGPFVDNLFSAVELMAKGLLIWMPDRKLLEGRRHGQLHSRFNYERKMDNVDPRFAQLLNRLDEVRRPARYLSRGFALAADEMDEMLAVAEEMHLALNASKPRRAPASNRP